MSMRVGSGTLPGDERRAEAIRGAPKEVEVAKEIMAEGGAFSFSGMPTELKSLIFQAEAFETWYDPLPQAMLRVNKEWNTLMPQSHLQSGDKVDLFVSQILKRAHYNLANVEEGVFDILTSDACREKVHILRPSHNVTDVELRALCKNFPNVHVLELESSLNLTPEGIKNALLECQNLTELRIANAQELTDTFLEEITEVCTELQRFELGSNVRYITAPAFEAFLERCPATHLVLPWYWSDVSMLSKPGRMRTHVDLPQCKAPENQLITFIQSASAQNLTYLGLRSARDAVTDQLLITLGENCKSLTSINLLNCGRFTVDGLQALLQGCPLIEQLELGGETITDEMLHIIALYGHNLKKITLYMCSNITDAGVQAVVQKCPLKSLTLSDCQAVTDSTLETVAEYRKELEELDIRSSKTSRYGLLQVILNCPKLKALDITGPGIIFSEFFAQTVASHLKHLERLRIDKPESSKALSNLLPACARLKYLCILEGGVIGDAELARIAKACKHLREIYLDKTACTKGGIHTFLNSCRLLERFSGKFPTVIRADIKKLTDAFPSVDIIL